MNINIICPRIALQLASIFVVMLYGYVGFISYGFDDEFFNIYIVENFSLNKIFYLDASENLNHPNGSLLLNGILFNLFNDWSYVRAFYGVIFALSLLISFFCLTEKDKNFNQLFFFILLCLNPSLLMIGSSIRWYSAFIIFINFLIVLIHKNPKNPLTFWGIFLILGEVLFYINYLASVILPIVFVYSLNQRRKLIYKNRKEVLCLILFILLFLFIAFPEVNSLLYKISIDQSNQISTFWMSIIGFGIFQTSGLAMMPSSYPGLVSILLSLSMLIVFLMNIKNQSIKFLSIYLLVCIFMLLSGLAGKFRTFFSIHLLDAYIKAHILSFIPKKWHAIIFFVLIIPVLAGSFNVVSKQNTNKSSWNMPYAITIDEVNKLVKSFDCKQALIFLHDPGLDWYLSKLAYNVVNIYNIKDFASLSANLQSDCQIYLKTFQGSMDAERKQKVDSFFDNKQGLVQKIFIQKDDFVKVKRILNKNFPEYYVEVMIFQ